jgi:hypothetical protein
VLLELGADAAERGLTVAGAAFGFAAWPPASWGQEATFRWRCRPCGQLIRDRGPGSGYPADGAPGHAEGCSRLAAAIAERDTAWARES